MYKTHACFCRGVGWGVEGSRLEAWMKGHKSEAAITFVCTPTNQETVLALPWDEHMNTGRNSEQTTCLSWDTGGKGTLPAQRTGFNTLDNWGHKAPTQSKRKRAGKKRLKGHGPEHVYNTLGYTFITYFRASLSKYLKFIRQLRAFFAWNKSLLKWAQSAWNKAKQLTVMFLPFNFFPFVSDSKRFLWSFHTWYPRCWK